MSLTIKEYCKTHEAGLLLKSECFQCLQQIIDEQKLKLEAFETHLAIYEADWLDGFYRGMGK